MNKMIFEKEIENFENRFKFIIIWHLVQEKRIMFMFRDMKTA